MPDLDNRKPHEEGLAATLMLVFGEHQSAEGDVDWKGFKEGLKGVLGQALSSVYQAAFSGLQKRLDLDLGEGVDVGEAADGWSDEYADVVAGLIVSNTRARLQEQLLAGNAPDLADQFSAERAEKIAVTETTRAVTAGEFGVVGMAVALGLLSVEDASPYWVTAEDDKVCPACSRLHNQPEEVWASEAPAGPPLHPWCRCYLSYAGLGLESRVAET